LRETRLLRATLAFAVSGGLLWFILSKIDLDAAIGSLRSASSGWIFFAALCSFVVLLLRTLRFQLLATRTPTLTLGAAVAVQYFLLRVTPMRLGDFSLPVLLARYADEPPAHTLVSLLITRLAELWVVVLTGIIAVIAAFGTTGMDRIAFGIPAVIAVSALIATFGAWMRLGGRVAMAVSQWPPLRERVLLQRLNFQLQAAISERSRLTNARWAAVLVMSAGVVIAQYACFASLMVAFQVRLPLAESVVGVSVAYLVSSAPFVTVGTIGTFEAGWVLGFTWVGLALETAILTAVASQVMTLVFTSIQALCGWAVLQRLRSRAALEPIMTGRS
jgi:hypothetical protein